MRGVGFEPTRVAPPGDRKISMGIHSETVSR
jgi:hypothetical protein